jgi:nucleoside-diphosphate-sugar epimerase
MPTTVPSPMEAYGHAKLAAEWACLAAARDGLDVSIVRPRTILGHGRLGIFGILFDWIADGHDPIVLGDGSNRYQFVHSDDLAEACVRAASTEGPDIFNVGTDRFGTMRETLADLCAHAGTGTTVRSLPATPASLGMRLSAALGISPFAPYHWMMYSKSMWFDLDHLQRSLAWTPAWSTADMFAQSYDWFVANRASVDDAGASHHRRSARQGGLAILKRWSSLLPEAR